jgi:hypothetical protein
MNHAASVPGKDPSGGVSDGVRPGFWRKYERVLLLLFSTLLVWQLFIPPSLGVADNNDFPKLMGRFCLGQVDHPLFEFATFRFYTGTSYCWNSGLPTSALLPLIGARWIARPFLPPGVFDLRILGGIYAALFVFTFWLLQITAREWSATARLLVPAAALLVFNTATYVPIFSTFFFDTPALVFLLLGAVCSVRLVLRGAVPTWEYLAAAACVILLATSKTQHSVLGLLTLPAFLFSFGRIGFPSKPVRLFTAVAIVAAVAAMFAAMPPWYSATNYYNALFNQCLPRSKDPVQDLARLQIDPAMIRYVGQHAFLPDSPMQNQRFIEEFSTHLSLRKMVRYYATHPRIAALVLENALGEGGLQRMTYLSNYEKSAGRPPKSVSGFLDFWSSWKRDVFAYHGLYYGVYALGLLAAVWIIAAKQTGRQRSRACTLAGMFTFMVMAAAGILVFDGVELGRHCFLLNALLDLGVCAMIGLAPWEQLGGRAISSPSS